MNCRVVFACKAPSTSQFHGCGSLEVSGFGSSKGGVRQWPIRTALGNLNEMHDGIGTSPLLVARGIQLSNRIPYRLDKSVIQELTEK